jgi:hypothetical protein
MAGESPHYVAWVLAQPCALQPCVAATECHHSTNASTLGAGEEPSGKRLGGRRGKGQRGHDDQSFPLCFRHHKQFHDGSGPFAGWDKQERRAWQDQQVRLHRDRYEAHLDKNPPLSAPAPKASKGGNSALAIANRERGEIVEWLRKRAGERRLSPEVFQELSDRADELEAMTSPLSMPRN